MNPVFRLKAATEVSDLLEMIHLFEIGPQLFQIQLNRKMVVNFCSSIEKLKFEHDLKIRHLLFLVCYGSTCIVRSKSEFRGVSAGKRVSPYPFV
jgi:hypothetical protein